MIFIAAKRRKTRDERKEAAEGREREVTDGTGTAEMKVQIVEYEKNKKELTTNCELSAGSGQDETRLDTIKCETDLLDNSEDRIGHGPKLRLQAGEKSFACTQCVRKFAQRYQLDRHQQIHTGKKSVACKAREKKISCPHCDKKFAHTSRLNDHMLVHTGEKPFACEVCDKKFAKNSILKKHYKYHKGEKPFACNDCNKKFIYKYALMYHRIRHTSEKPTCPDCNKKFSCKDNLVRHRKALHSCERPRPFACPECDKKFYTKLHMTEHYKSHTGERPYVCEKCGNSYARKVGFLYHSCSQTRKTRVFTFTVPNGEGLFVCPICGKKFTTGALLRTHYGLHTDRFVCSACDKRFGTCTALKEHSYMHTGERPFVCETCGDDFARKSHFRTHLLLHSNKNVFACSDCDVKFGRRSDLTVHRRVHGKFFSCNVCRKTFAEKRYLIAHIRIHTGEKPFACSYCDKTFACKSNLLVHRRKHTGEKRTPRKPHIEIFNSRLIESPSIECHVTNKSSISDIDVIDSGLSCESQTMRESTGIYTGQVADDSSGEKSFACSQCDEKFALESDLNAHFRFHASYIHTGEKHFVCEICGEDFAQKTLLENHVLLHKGHNNKNLLACSDCDMKFGCRSDLTVHRRIHGNKFSCDKCEKTFAVKSYLSAHMKRIHTGEKRSPHFTCHATEKPTVSEPCIGDMSWAIIRPVNKGCVEENVVIQLIQILLLNTSRWKDWFPK